MGSLIITSKKKARKEEEEGYTFPHYSELRAILSSNSMDIRRHGTFLAMSECKIYQMRINLSHEHSTFNAALYR
jgi:hypothetical protein